MEQVTFDLKAWRQARDMTVARLARELGMSRWTVTRMESAGEVPKVVAMALGVDKES